MIRHFIVLCAVVLASKSVVAQMPSPALLVVDKPENQLTIVDPIARKVVARIPTGDEPHSVAASPDGKLAFVANTAGGKGVGTISVIDLIGRKEIRQIIIGPQSRPHSIVFAGKKVYFTAEGYKLIGCYNPETDKVEWLLGTGQRQSVQLAVDNTESRIFTANVTSLSVTGIEVGKMERNGTADWIQTVIPVTTEPHSIAVSPDGKEVWVGGRLDGHFTIIDAANKKVLQTMDLPSWATGERMKFTPDGRQVLIPNSGMPGPQNGKRIAGGGEIAVLDVATRKEIRRIQVGPEQHLEEILVVPDGSTAYVAASAGGSVGGVAIIDLKSMEVIARVPTGKAPEGMAWIASR